MIEEPDIITGDSNYVQKRIKAYLKKWPDGKVLSSSITTARDKDGKKETTCLVIMGRDL